MEAWPEQPVPPLSALQRGVGGDFVGGGPEIRCAFRRQDPEAFSPLPVLRAHLLGLEPHPPHAQEVGAHGGSGWLNAANPKKAMAFKGFSSVGANLGLQSLEQPFTVVRPIADFHGVELGQDLRTVKDLVVLTLPTVSRGLFETLDHA